MKRIDVTRILVALLAVGGMITVGGCSSPENDAANKMGGGVNREARKTAGVTGAGTAGTAAVGKKLFGALCKGCHGKEGRGDVGPNLTVSTYKYGKSRPEIIKTITGGRPGGMPSFISQLDKEQIESLAEFVLTLK